MTNELAIRILTGDVLGTAEQTHDAIKMAVEALSQLDVDTISRQSAIDVAMQYCPDDDGSCSKAGADIREMLDELEALPPAQPEQRWIPVTERLPEEHEWMGTKKFGTTISDEVYVTFENPKGERFCKHISFQNGKLSSFDQSAIDAFYKGSKPIAWMPLPKPWRGEEE